MIQAAQAAFLVTAQYQGDATMGTVFVERSDAAVAVAKDDDIFIEEARPHWWTVRIDNLRGLAQRQPIALHQRAHRRIPRYATQQLILPAVQHCYLPTIFALDVSIAKEFAAVQAAIWLAIQS